MSSLIFQGTVKAGIGRFSELTIPGRSQLQDAPADWPDALCPGSLNVLVDDGGYPSEFLHRCNGELIQKLDSGCFRPALEIRRADIANNKLQPTSANPRRGDAQVWRAELRNPSNQEAAACWVVRRFGSGLKRQIEIVASERLRDTLDLSDGTAVTVVVNGEWY